MDSLRRRHGSPRGVKQRRPVYLRLGDARVYVRTFRPEGDKAFVGNVESITAPLPAGEALEPGDWVLFEPQHIFSTCISHE